MPIIPENCEILEGLLTTRDLCRLFGRSPLTITLWRQHEGLPYVRDRGEGRDTIRFREERVRAWAQETGRTLQGETPRVRLQETTPA